MTNEILVKPGTAITWEAAGGTYPMTMAGVLSNEGRQGAKGNLGTKRADRFSFTVEHDMAAATAAPDNILEFYWSSSPSATAGVQNDGAASGVDAAYTGSAGGTVDETKVQLIWVDNLVLTPDAATVVQQTTFVFSPPHQYGMPVIINKSDQSMGGDNSIHRITVTPIINEVQDSV